MAGHLFIFSEQRISGSIAKEKRIPIAQKQLMKVAGLSKDDLIFLAARDKNNNLKIWLTAKAATGIVSNSGKVKYVRLKFAKLRTALTSYELCQGLTESQTLADYDWRELNERETAGCLFNTQKFSQSISKVKQFIADDVPSGMNINPEAVISSVVWNVEGSGSGCALRNWYDARVLLDQDKYASALRQRLQELSGDQFEQLMSLFFSIPYYGFSVIKTQQTRDNGVDLFLTSSSELYGQLYVAVQCKRQEANITEQKIELLRSAMSKPANFHIDGSKPSKGILVTTSRFTLPAQQYAKQEGCIHLIDGNELSRLFFQHAEQAPGMWSILNSAKSQPTQHSLFQPIKPLPKPPRRNVKKMAEKAHDA